jgi:hypothetical protein
VAARRALIVATGTYQDPKLRQLRAPAADADLLALVLRDPSIGDFEVDIAVDENEASLRRRLARFFAAASRDDVLLAHFSCHGVKDAQGALYLATSDTEMDLLEATAIPAPWLDEQLTRSPSRRKLLLLDCCFSGKFPFDAVARSGESVDVHERFEGRGRAVITASNAMEYAYEGDHLSGSGKPSYFTSALIEALQTGEADRDQDSWISVDELYDYIFDRVKEISPQQTPTKQIALEGPLYVARSNYRRPVEPARLDKQLLELTEHPVAAARLGAVDELARLMASENAAVALAARNALERMLDDDSRRVAAGAQAALRGEAEAEAPAAGSGEEPEMATTGEGSVDVVEPTATQRVEHAAAGDSPRAAGSARLAGTVRPTGGQIVASVFALLLLGSVFLPWYGYSGDRFWDWGADKGARELPGAALWVLGITVFVGLCFSAAPLVIRELRPPPKAFRVLVTLLGLVSVIVIFYLGVLHYPSGESSTEFGVVAGLISAIGVALGGYISLGQPSPE